MDNLCGLPPALSLRRGCRRAALLGLVLVSGCRMIHEAETIPSKTVSAIVPARKEQPSAPDVLQIELQRCADDYLGRTVAALGSYAQRVGTAEARQQALQWKLAQASSVIAIVSGPNPSANLADLMALATTTRLALEDHWSKTAEGEAFQPWLETSRELEPKVWKLAEGILTPAQQQEFRNSIERGWQTNAGQSFAFFARPQQVSALFRQSGQKAATPDSVLAIVGLDPTAGLDPAVREVTRTRLFAERALYATQRMPLLLRWQTELLAEDLLGSAQVAAALTHAASLSQSADRLSRAAESVAQTAAQLPDRLGAERQALVAAMEGQEDKLRQLSRDATQTLAAGERMSASLDTTLTTFDALMQRFGVGVTNAAPRSEPDVEPFRITDYEQTAARIETAARQLNELLLTLDRTAGSTNLAKLSEQVAPLVQQARASGVEVVDYAFKRGVVLVVMVLAAALIYRLCVGRLMGMPSAKKQS